MSSQDLDLVDLVRRAKYGAVSDEEIRGVATALREGATDPERYDLIYVLGRSFAYEYEDLIASYLEYPRDAWVARCALEVLCRMWDGQQKYRDQLHRFLVGVSWDDGSVRMVALTATGDYLATHFDAELWKDLLRRASSSNSDTVELRVAIDSLAAALGMDFSDVIRSRGNASDLGAWNSEIRARGIERLEAGIPGQSSQTQTDGSAGSPSTPSHERPL